MLRAEGASWFGGRFRRGCLSPWVSGPQYLTFFSTMGPTTKMTRAMMIAAAGQSIAYPPGMVTHTEAPASTHRKMR